jgi:hypothetical protein
MYVFDNSASESWGVAAQDKEAWRKLTRLTDVRNISSNKPDDTACTELNRRIGITAG